MDKNQLSLEYLIRTPKDNKTEEKNCIIMLHGIGSNKEDLFSFADSLNDNILIISAQAPNRWKNFGWSWYDIEYTTQGAFSNIEQYFQALEIVRTFIDEVKTNFSPSKIYLMGFSQGAIISYGIALTSPEYIDGIMALSGFILEPVKSKLADIEEIKKVKFFAVHGIYDNVISVQQSDESIEYLQSLGIECIYNKYAMPHGLSPDCLNDIVEYVDGL